MKPRVENRTFVGIYMGESTHSRVSEVVRNEFCQSTLGLRFDPSHVDGLESLGKATVAWTTYLVTWVGQPAWEKSFNNMFCCSLSVCLTGNVSLLDLSYLFRGLGQTDVGMSLFGAPPFRLKGLLGASLLDLL